MTDPHQELAELVAGVRALLQDAALRGAWAEPADAELPEPEPPAGERSPGEPPTGGSTGTPAPEPAAAKAGAWSELASRARARAEQAATTGEAGLKRVRADLGDCRRCKLCTDRTHIVFGVGSGGADLMVIGEAPGFHEDRQGEPFVGKAGQMLDRMLENVIGLERSETYITNIVKCRPPGNRNPLPDEVDACRPFLDRQIRAIEPKVMLVLGTVAFKTLFETRQGIMRNRGIWKEYDGVPVMPTLHPAYLLRNPSGKRQVFEDLKALRARYDELDGRRPR